MKEMRLQPGLTGHREEPRLCLQGPGEPRKGLEEGRGRSLWLCVKSGWERMGLREEARKEVEGVWERKCRISGEGKGSTLKNIERERKEGGKKERKSKERETDLCSQ